MTSINLISRLVLSIIWLYHGIFPKLLYKSGQEIEMNNTFMPMIAEHDALLYSGIAEVVYGILLLTFFKSFLLLIPSLLFSIIATIFLIIKLPHFFELAFNPFSLNLSVFTLALINILSLNKKPVSE
jgi:hypothetical protein